VVQGVVMVNIGNDEEKLKGGDERRHDGEESKSDAVRTIREGNSGKKYRSIEEET